MEENPGPSETPNEKPGISDALNQPAIAYPEDWNIEYCDDMQDVGSLLYNTTLISGLSNTLKLAIDNELNVTNEIESFLDENGDPVLNALQSAEMFVKSLTQPERQGSSQRNDTVFLSHLLISCSEVLQTLENIEDHWWPHECKKNLEIFLAFLMSNSDTAECATVIQTISKCELLQVQIITVQISQVNNLASKARNDSSSPVQLKISEALLQNLEFFLNHLKEGASQTSRGRNMINSHRRQLRLRKFHQTLSQWEESIRDSHRGLLLWHPEFCEHIWSCQILIESALKEAENIL